MTSTDWEVNVHLMDVLFINLPPIPVYGVAHIHGVDNIIQHMNEEPQDHHQQDPRHESNEVCIIAKMHCSF